MQRIELKVGDRSFFTTVSTLETSHFFKNLLTHSGDASTIYLDRDSTQFRHILNYLRGSPFLPSANDDLEELAIEADYYGLERLRDEIFERLVENRHKYLPSHRVSLLCASSEVVSAAERCRHGRMWSWRRGLMARIRNVCLERLSP